MEREGMITETERLALREMTREDFTSLCEILMDGGVMYAYEGAFSEEEARAWLEKQLGNYAQYGFGLWAVVLKETGEMIGQCGLTMQYWGAREVLEIGYLFKKKHWHHGYASEAAAVCRKYAFEKLGAEEVFSIIRDTNTASQNVAKRNGMALAGSFVKHYRGVDMPHVVYSVRRPPAGSDDIIGELNCQRDN
jgi:[ribosomal protein S5]-alanine N-acetyltransferase